MKLLFLSIQNINKSYLIYMYPKMVPKKPTTRPEKSKVSNSYTSEKVKMLGLEYRGEETVTGPYISQAFECTLGT